MKLTIFSLAVTALASGAAAQSSGLSSSSQASNSTSIRSTGAITPTPTTTRFVTPLGPLVTAATIPVPAFVNSSISQGVVGPTGVGVLSISNSAGGIAIGTNGLPVGPTSASSPPFPTILVQGSSSSAAAQGSSAANGGNGAGSASTSTGNAPKAPTASPASYQSSAIRNYEGMTGMVMAMALAGVVVWVL